MLGAPAVTAAAGRNLSIRNDRVHARSSPSIKQASRYQSYRSRGWRLASFRQPCAQCRASALLTEIQYPLAWPSTLCCNGPQLSASLENRVAATFTPATCPLLLSPHSAPGSDQLSISLLGVGFASHSRASFPFFPLPFPCAFVSQLVAPPATSASFLTAALVSLCRKLPFPAQSSHRARACNRTPRSRLARQAPQDFRLFIRPAFLRPISTTGQYGRLYHHGAASGLCPSRLRPPAAATAAAAHAPTGARSRRHPAEHKPDPNCAYLSHVRRSVAWRQSYPVHGTSCCP
jgi:hypothetical protein